MLRRLADDPTTPRVGVDLKMLESLDAGRVLYRVRVGDYRVLYDVGERDDPIRVLVVGHRGAGYARLGSAAKRRAK